MVDITLLTVQEKKLQKELQDIADKFFEKNKYFPPIEITGYYIKVCNHYERLKRR